MTLLAEGAGRYAGPLGLLVVLLIGVALVLLVRSMNGHVRRLPDSFPQQPQEGDRGEDGAG